jgi:ArsR family transcriptional regulator
LASAEKLARGIDAFLLAGFGVGEQLVDLEPADVLAGHAADGGVAAGSSSSGMCAASRATTMRRLRRRRVVDVDILTLDDMSETLTPIACCQPLDGLSLRDEEIDATAALFKALSDPARVKIVNVLAQANEPVCACEFEPALRLAQPTVSHHLRKLTEAGLLEREQRGKWAYFSLRRDAIAKLAAVADLTERAAR